MKCIPVNSTLNEAATSWKWFKVHLKRIVSKKRTFTPKGMLNTIGVTPIPKSHTFAISRKGLL